MKWYLLKSLVSIAYVAEPRPVATRALGAVPPNFFVPQALCPEKFFLNI